MDRTNFSEKSLSSSKNLRAGSTVPASEFSPVFSIFSPDSVSLSVSTASSGKDYRKIQKKRFYRKENFPN